MNVRVKICGVRRPSDAERAVELGADFIGCVLAPDSPRRATPAEVREIQAAVFGRAQVVLVFRAGRPGEIEAAVEATGVFRVQPHGADPETCRALEAQGLTVHRVYRLAKGARALPVLSPSPAEHRPALLDGGAGGSGITFDWRLLAPRAPGATFIAGGLSPENLAELLPYQPYGIDLSSGVESAPGIKDRDRLCRLFECLEDRA